jgi:DNA-directed RNA polymerase subunit N (RpoN/RPB10)
MLEFKRRVLEFKLDDVKHSINYPNVRQTSKFSEEYDESKNKIDTIINFLDELGFEKDVCESMEVEHLNQILEKLTEAKK